MTKTFYLFIKLILIWSLCSILIGCENNANKAANEEYNQQITKDRVIKDAELVDTTVSRFNAEEREAFSKKGLQYYRPNIDYKLLADFDLDTSYPVFQMPTTTDRKPNYRIYGYLYFEVNDTICKLVVFQNYDMKDHPEHGQYVFIPFKDNTNEYTTYGGGRYIDIGIPKTNKVELDFNLAYNPYCAYSPRWSCPLVPGVNSLGVAVMAGEKSYK